MKRVTACLILALALGLAACGQSREKPGPVLQNDRYLVGATYYIWYPLNFYFGFMRGALKPPQSPSMGLYDSSDPKVAERHIAWCSRYGIDFLAVSWWPNKPEINPAIDKGLLKARNLKDIKFCIFYETWGVGWVDEKGATIFDQAAIDKLNANMDLIADKYFDNPSYLKINGRPVVFLYLTRTLAGDYEKAFTDLRARLKAKGHDVYFIADEIYWSVMSTRQSEQPKPFLEPKPQPERIKLFDALTSYNMYLSSRKDHGGYGAKSNWVRDVGKIYRQYFDLCGPNTNFVPNILPGYNDRGCRLPMQQFVIPRQWDKGAPEGSFLAQSFDKLALPFVDPRLNMIMITSFNEWNEDTAIEPTIDAPPTNHDISDSGHGFTDGYEYYGYGTKMLEVVRDKVCSVSGRVTDQAGNPLWGAEVTASQNGKTIAKTTTDCEGYYTFSRLLMPPGQYEVNASVSAQTVEVNAQICQDGVDFMDSAAR